MKTRKTRLAQSGFTLIELLMAMALVIFIMSIISHTFSSGLNTFRHLKAIGDLDETLTGDASALAEAITMTNRQARDFIQNGLETGTVDREEAAELRQQYEAICAAAVDVEVRLREVQSHIQDPQAQRVLQRSLNDLERFKYSAATMVSLLRLIE